MRGSLLNVLLAIGVAVGTPAASTAADDPGDGLPSVLVSRQLAEARGLAVDDVVSLAAERDGAGARPFRIAAIYEPLPDPMRLGARYHEARLHLPDLLEMVSDPEGRDTVDAINVALVDPGEVAVFRRDLAGRVPGLYALPTVPDDATNPFLALERFHFAIAIVTVLGSAAFLIALMIMRADERRETVGILRLIGLTRGRILLEVLVEGAMIALAGAVFGIAFAWLLQHAVNLFFQYRYDTALVFMRITAEIGLRCVLIAVPLGIAAGFVASWTVLRRDAAELLRR